MVGIRHGFQSYLWNQNSLNNKKKLEDFPDVPVVKNPPCNAGTSGQVFQDSSLHDFSVLFFFLVI